jgi:hypothetical protein
MNMKRIIKTIGWSLTGVLGVVALLFLYFNLPGPAPRRDVTLGVTFSSRYAEDLGLDWKEAYKATLDEIGVKKVRLPVYWDRVESRPGEYDFSDIDWQLEEARRRNVEVVLAVGQKVPRWPECFIPEWAQGSDDVRRSALLKLVAHAVKRYQNHSEIVMWQVENEPFLKFGVCPPFEVMLLEQEIALVKQVDPSRPVLVTDSGELSLWVPAARRGDVFGTTMYRDIWKEGIGHVTYPLGPNFFLTKAFLVRLLTDQRHLIVIELQAEPWASGWVGHVSLEEQFQTMNEHRLRENVEYARRVGFPEIYLWGVEWWYWLKEKKDYPAVWEEAKRLFEEAATQE